MLWILLLGFLINWFRLMKNFLRDHQHQGYGMFAGVPID